MADRLQKILSRAGIASRRAAEKLMVDGRVTVNGIAVCELGTKADPTDDIRVDGRRIRLVEQRRYLLMNKPRGYVTTRQDPQGRPTVMDVLRGVHDGRRRGGTERPEHYVYPVGRLDYASEGLLILTNDGDLAAMLMHPRHGVARTYEAEVAGVPDPHDLERLRRGVVLDGRKTRPAEVRMVSAAERQGPSARPMPRERFTRERSETRRPPREGRATVRITIREGRHRQVRRMFDAIGHPVDRLRRVQFGPIRDEHLKPGQWRELSADEVRRLRAAAEEPHASPHPKNDERQSVPTPAAGGGTATALQRRKKP